MVLSDVTAFTDSRSRKTMALLASRPLAMTAMLFCLVRVSGETKVPLSATANKLVFEENGIYPSSSYQGAVDGQLSQEWFDCAVSASSTPTVWLSIDLGRIYSVNKIRLLSRLQFGRASRIYVGKNASTSHGTNDHQCESSVVFPDPAPSTFIDFPCSPVDWVQYVSIRRSGYTDRGGNQYLQVCEVEVYYDETEDPGVTITKNAIAVSKLDITIKGDILVCGSSKGDFTPTWKFPNGTDVPEQNSVTIQQADGSSGYKELHLSPLPSTPPNGQYECQYSSNNFTKVKTVNLTFSVDCQVSSWAACSSSCGLGTRTRTITQIKVGAGQDCPSPLSNDCANKNCGQIDMKAINAVATHGPLATWQTSDGAVKLPASLAIDGMLSGTKCAATDLSTKPWLRVDLKTAYLIRSVETSFREDRGNGAFVRIGSDLTNDGNDNPLCGTVPSRNSGASIWTATITCSSLLWGRYINVQKISSSIGYLSVCELKANYELDVGIFYNDSSAASGSYFVYGGRSLSLPVLCGVNPDSTNLNSLLNIQWKSGSLPVSLSNPNVGESVVNNFTSLHIWKAPSTDTTYTCQYTWIDSKQKTLQFNLSINVDCGWSSWSVCPGSCGVGTRVRTADSPVRKHQGKHCVGDSSEDCDTGKVPCSPTPSSSFLSVEEGQTAFLTCNASQYSQLQTAITFEWFKKGVQTSNHSNSFERSLGNGTYQGILTFALVKKTDANLYTCKANGHNGLSNSSVAIQLDVTYAPFNVILKADSSVFLKNQPLTLNCSAEANPAPFQYKWRKDGQIISGETGSQISFSSLDYSNSGTYDCTVNNSVGEAQSNGFVIAVDGPPGQCSSPSGASAVGNLIEVTASQCPLNGNAGITEYRILYRTLGSSTAWLEVVETSLPVNITGLTPYTVYEVSVAASNQYGYGPISDPVSVRTAQGEPGPPMNVQAVSMGPSRIRVTWSKPVNPSGLINNYWIFYRESANSGNTSISVPGLKTKANLTQLAPYTVYNIQIAAVNIRDSDKKVLFGTRSNEVIVETDEAAPSAPLQVSATLVSLSSVQMSWDPPLYPNGIIRSYDIVYTLANGPGHSVRISVPKPVVAWQLDGLQQSVIYNVSIRAVTTLPGLWSHLLVLTGAVTPSPPVEIRITSKTYKSIFVSWKSPLNPNGVIRTYRLYYWRLDDVERVVSSVESISSSFNLTGLRAYTRYQINVTVINNADMFPESSPAIVIDKTLIIAPERPPSIPNSLEEMAVDSKGVVHFTAPFISDEKVPISYIKIFLFFGRRPIPSSVPPSANRNDEIWRQVASYNYSHYNLIRNDLSVDAWKGDNNQDKNTMFSIYFVAYAIDVTEELHLESSSGPSTFYANSDINGGQSEQVSATSLFGSVGIAFLALFAITLIAFIALFVAYVRLRQTLKNSYHVKNEGQIYERPNRKDDKCEGDIMPKKTTLSSAYVAATVKYQKGDSGEETYAEICTRGEEGK